MMINVARESYLHIMNVKCIQFFVNMQLIGMNKCTKRINDLILRAKEAAGIDPKSQLICIVSGHLFWQLCALLLSVLCQLCPFLPVRVCPSVELIRRRLERKIHLSSYPTSLPCLRTTTSALIHMAP